MASGKIEICSNETPKKSRFRVDAGSVIRAFRVSVLMLLLPLCVQCGSPGEAPDIPLFPFDGVQLPDQLLGNGHFEMREFIEAFEEAACEAPVSRDCRVINALSNTAGPPMGDSGPRIPEEFPRRFDIAAEGPAGGVEEVDADQWADEADLPGIGSMHSVFPVDFSSLFADFLPESDIQVTAVSLDFLTNSLNFEAQQVVLLVDPEPLPDDRPPPPPGVLEQRQRARPVGVFPPRPPGAVGSANMIFNEGGRDRLSEALNSRRFTGVIKINQVEPKPLPEGAQPNRRRRPAGTTDINLKVGIAIPGAEADE